MTKPEGFEEWSATEKAEFIQRRKDEYESHIEALSVFNRQLGPGKNQSPAGKLPELFIKRFPVFQAKRWSESRRMCSVNVTIESTNIVYDGPTLTTFEEDMLLTVLSQKANEVKTIEEAVYRTSYRKLASELKMSWCSSNLRKLKVALKRLQKGSIEIKHDNREACFHLINELWIDHTSGEICIRITPTFLRLFMSESSYRVGYEARLLIKHHIAERLYSYAKTFSAFREGRKVTFKLSKLEECLGFDLPSTETKKARMLKSVVEALLLANVACSIYPDAISLHKLKD